MKPPRRGEGSADRAPNLHLIPLAFALYLRKNRGKTSVRATLVTVIQVPAEIREDLATQL